MVVVVKLCLINTDSDNEEGKPEAHILANFQRLAVVKMVKPSHNIQIAFELMLDAELLKIAKNARWQAPFILCKLLDEEEEYQTRSAKIHC